MCGIAGFAGRGTREDLSRMATALERRGPDDEGIAVFSQAGFAFRRLSIIDLAGGAQPMSNEDGSIWVMQNGEIYGYQSLKEELERAGHRFRTHSDTEVILRAYEAWGDDCFQRLNGMFAIAIWDGRTNRLLLARDRLGKKPLHWTVQNGTIWFASELKALLAANVFQKRIDPVSLELYFRYDYVPTPRTMFHGVYKLEPGTVAVWHNGSFEVSRRFWMPETEPLPEMSFDEAAEETGQRIDRAVAERLIADVPLGLFLSGGIDSTVIAESAARQSDHALQAFTIGFEEASHDERPFARIVAEALGLELHEDVVSVDRALGLIRESDALLDEPLADPSILPQLLLSSFTRSHVKVALSGDGGDELFLGYQHIAAHRLMQRFNGVPLFLRRGLASLMANIPAGAGYFSAGFKLQRFARGLMTQSPWERDLAWRGAFEADRLADILLCPPRTSFAGFLLQQRAEELGERADFWSKWSWMYLRSFLMDDVMVKVDRATMWHGLESRAPLLDPRVVEFALRVPHAQHLKHGPKSLLKALVKGKVPKHIIDRKKHGFGVPTAAWLRGPLRAELLECSNASHLEAQGLFRSKGVEAIVNEHVSGRRDRRKELWAFFVFQHWYDRWMTG